MFFREEALYLDSFPLRFCLMHQILNTFYLETTFYYSFENLQLFYKILHYFFHYLSFFPEKMELLL